MRKLGLEREQVMELHEAMMRLIRAAKSVDSRPNQCD